MLSAFENTPRPTANNKSTKTYDVRRETPTASTPKHKRANVAGSGTAVGISNLSCLMKKSSSNESAQKRNAVPV